MLSGTLLFRSTDYVVGKVRIGRRNRLKPSTGGFAKPMAVISAIFCCPNAMCRLILTAMSWMCLSTGSEDEVIATTEIPKVMLVSVLT